MYEGESEDIRVRTSSLGGREYAVERVREMARVRTYDRAREGKGEGEGEGEGMRSTVERTRARGRACIREDWGEGEPLRG